jgi:hypothetical protein
MISIARRVCLACSLLATLLPVAASAQPRCVTLGGPGRETPLTVTSEGTLVAARMFVRGSEIDVVSLGRGRRTGPFRVSLPESQESRALPVFDLQPAGEHGVVLRGRAHVALFDPRRGEARWIERIADPRAEPRPRSTDVEAVEVGEDQVFAMTDDAVAVFRLRDGRSRRRTLASTGHHRASALLGQDLVWCRSDSEASACLRLDSRLRTRWEARLPFVPRHVRVVGDQTYVFGSSSVIPIDDRGRLGDPVAFEGRWVFADDAHVLVATREALTLRRFDGEVRARWAQPRTIHTTVDAAAWDGTRLIAVRRDEPLRLTRCEADACQTWDAPVGELTRSDDFVVVDGETLVVGSREGVRLLDFGRRTVERHGRGPALVWALGEGAGRRVLSSSTRSDEVCVF